MSEQTTERITTYSQAGLAFDVRDEGPLDGDPVMLLHGFPERSTSWRHVAPLLHDAGLRTLAPDQRGYSPGARPPRRRDYRLTDLVGDLVALVDRLGRPVHLVGHDWGAVVAWHAAATRPDLIRTLTAVSVPHPAAFSEAVVSTTQGLRSWYMGFFQLPFLPELGLRLQPVQALLRRSGMTEADLARFRTEIVEYGALPGALAWYRALPLTPPGAARTEVTVPTTLVWSDGDVAIGRGGVERTPRWVSGPYELVVLEGVSHWIPTHAPDALAEAVLARIGSAG